ncbi:unnamed protein product [Adineta ricciae]|uniref:Uncharacterized protein n=1 Tax=Adineta ricciae TaxID=249248 RepID=A0A816D5I4_ADIRI|nr:unnamed protein product [Adineta ricciae]CAF1629912.1 unnamed protein product [Adineta ricciae]
MNYYFLLVLSLNYQLATNFCYSLPAPPKPNEHLHNTNHTFEDNKSCVESVTYIQVLKLIREATCSQRHENVKIIPKTKYQKRELTANNDIKALQTTINDHRVMIEYLFNSSINQTTLTKIFQDHSRRPPTFSSWRDIIDIICIIIIIGALIHFLICIKGNSMCDRTIGCLFRPVLRRIQTQNKPTHQRASPLSNYAAPKTAPKITTVSEHLRSLSKIADYNIPPSSAN